MSEASPAPPPPMPAPRPRPATVTVAGLLMLLLALTAVVYVVASIVVLGPTTDAFNEAFAGTDLEDTGAVIAATSVATAVIYLLFGLALVILSVFNNRGRNGARIATWVVGGVALCCGGLSLISLAVPDLSTGGMGQQPDMPDAEEIERIVAEHLPSWYDPVIIGSSVVGVLALAVALLLLALPASNEFFRRPEQPPAQTPGYPPVG